MKNSKESGLSKAGLLSFESLCDKTVNEWFKAKHRRPSTAEIELVNGFKISECPHCGSKRIKRSWHYGNGTRRYRYLDAGGRSPLAGTLFDPHKMPLSEWIENLINLFEFHSVSSSSRYNRNAKSTERYWITKAFAMLSSRQDDVKLSVRIYLDKTYLPIMPKDEKRKGGKLYRGLSKNKICVASVTDGTSVFWPSAVRQRRQGKIAKAFSDHITECSTIVHDGEICHSVLVDRYKFKEKVHKSSKTKWLAEPFRFIATNKGRSHYEKAKKFLQMAILTHKVVRYRDVISGNRNK